MKLKTFYLIIILLSHFLISCALINNPKELTGFAVESQPLAHAQIQLIDANGKLLTTQSDENGKYHFLLSNVKAPFFLTAVSNGDRENCIRSDNLRPVCLVALVEKQSSAKIQIANINPLTDRLISDMAINLGFIGPQQWVNSGHLGKFDPDVLSKALTQQRTGFSAALQQLTIDVKSFDPVSYATKYHQSMLTLFALLHHNRNYDNNSGEAAHTSLTDIGFHPLVGLFPSGDYEKFDLQCAIKNQQKIAKAKHRIFILGDSTSAVYEELRYPRKGWGQSLAEKYNHLDEIEFVVASRAGRSSRDFYNGRWFAQVESLIQPGDYVMIAHGHNDQNCDLTKPLRGAADVKNLCTYPNNNGQMQYPIRQMEFSFQHTLENYIQIARKKSAIPILVTPVTRIKNSQGLQETPVADTHITKQNSSRGYLFVGSYAQTIKDTAEKNAVPLLDLETASMEFVNNLEVNDWKNYWLVVDPKQYPFYKDQPGSLLLPDGTHFQEKGAKVMAGLLVSLIKQHPDLKDLSVYLNM